MIRAIGVSHTACKHELRQNFSISQLECIFICIIYTYRLNHIASSIQDSALGYSLQECDSHPPVPNTDRSNAMHLFLRRSTCSSPLFRYNVYTYEGSDDPWVVDSGRMQDNVVSDNTIIGGPESIKLGAADGTRFIDNTFEDPTKIRFQDSSETLMSGNTGLDNVKLRIVDGACFDDKSDSAFTPTC